MSKRKFAGRNKNNLFLVVAIKEAEYFSKKRYTAILLLL